MRSGLLDKKIPTFIGLIAITLGILFTTILIRGQNILQINASPSSDPKNIQITNITDSTFTVSYTTDGQAIGTVTYGDSQTALNNVVLDDRDQLSQSVNKYFVHSITLHNLSSDTNYYFSITSGSKKYLSNNSPYQVKTGNEISSQPLSQNPIVGSVIAPDGSTPPQGLVYVNINGSQKISGLTKADGSYTLPLNNLRNASLNDYFNLDANSIIAIEITTGTLISNVSVSASDINPVPVITLSNNYDFSSPLNVSPTGQVKNSNQSFPSVGSTNSSTQPKILTPKTDEQFSDQQPNFDGTAGPNQTVNIEIHSDEKISTQVTTASNGTWSYRPEKPLSPGDHTITITTKDSQGILQTITQRFTVFAAGSEVNQSATPSGTLTPSPSPVITQELSPTMELTATPVSSESQSLSPAPTLPPTGNSSVIIAFVAGFSALMAGVVLFLLSNKKIPL